MLLATWHVVPLGHDVDDRSYFEEMYRDSDDPWEFGTSPYEQRKYAVTVASLPRIRYRSAYEPGCSIGVLTELLATRCDRLLSSDIIPSALQRPKLDSEGSHTSGSRNVRSRTSGRLVHSTSSSSVRSRTTST